MLEVQTYFLSEVGGRSRNEDACGYWTSSGGCCWVVSDGAGGHGSGDIAARLVVSTVLNLFAPRPSAEPDDAVALLEAANDAVVNEKGSGSTTDDMHATAVILLIDRPGGTAVWGHVGDTRIYLFRHGQVVYQTRDHTVVQNLIDAGYGSVDMIRTHPQRSLLTSAIGSNEALALSVVREATPLTSGDFFLLCTDGWWEHIQESEMEELLAEASCAAEWLGLMRRLIRQRAPSDNDNYTALCVTVSDQVPDETTVIL
ncbi:MAG: protein phosphatase 2C domain-containing protein [Candidatus Accumulibacter sp.]|uniref:PP2C family protein-serine/threonine phosphatase n=1 Tax=Accumulibacter sp. TaxID=2053492 RepID=UPI0028796252|nr:protein phosphatase 2C domain-containing protein [Accumulibacter sp.]MDS4015080.1 protein phosphatase 2C domain-containing protein [Accumulibacter sp.]